MKFTFLIYTQKTSYLYTFAGLIVKVDGEIIFDKLGYVYDYHN